MCQNSLRDLILFCTSEAHLAGIKGVSRSLELHLSLFWSYIVTLSCSPLLGYGVNEEGMEGKKEKSAFGFCLFFICLISLESNLLVFV